MTASFLPHLLKRALILAIWSCSFPPIFNHVYFSEFKVCQKSFSFSIFFYLSSSSEKERSSSVSATQWESVRALRDPQHKNTNGYQQHAVSYHRLSCLKLLQQEKRASLNTCAKYITMKCRCWTWINPTLLKLWPADHKVSYMKTQRQNHCHGKHPTLGFERFSVYTSLCTSHLGWVWCIHKMIQVGALWKHIYRQHLYQQSTEI